MDLPALAPAPAFGLSLEPGLQRPVLVQSMALIWVLLR
jgi:hypothetical protein